MTQPKAQATLSDMFPQSVAVLSKPSVATFEQFERRGGTTEAAIYVVVGAVIAALAGLLSGHPGRGLPPELAARLPGPIAVYSGVAVAELAMLTVAAVGGVLFWRYHRPGDARRGMATRGEAAQVLGRSRLRAARAIIRPDLYGPAASRNQR